jgi:recombination protein RecA
LEEIWRQIEHIVEKVTTLAPDTLTTIIVDSIAAASCETEVAEDISKAEMGLRARINSKGLRKVTGIINDSNICLILINQIRANIGVIYGDKTLTPGGNAIDFHCTVKLRVNKGPVILQEGTKTPIGQIARIKNTKNKLAPPFRKAELQLFFDRGIPLNSGVVEKLTEDKVLVRKGGYLVFKDGTKFRESDIDRFIEEHPYLLNFDDNTQHISPDEAPLDE